MEIIPFLRLSGQRLVVLWVIAGIAGALGAFYANQLPVNYTGEATVFLERVYLGPRFEREPFVASYQSSVKYLTDVHERVGSQLGMSASDVGNALSIEVPPGSDTAYVRFTADNPDTATNGAESLANETLVTLASETVRAAEAALDRAKALEVEAQSQVDAVTGPLGVLDLQREHQLVDDQVKELEKQVALMQPTDPSLPNLTALLEFRRSQRAQYAQALPAYERAKQRLDTLKDQEATAQTNLDTAVARVAVAQNGEAVVSQGAEPESGLQKMIRFGGAAAIVAGVLVLMVFVVIEAMSRPRRSQQRVQPPTRRATPPAAFPAAPGSGSSNGAQPVGAGRPFQSNPGPGQPGTPPQPGN